MTLAVALGLASSAVSFSYDRIAGLELLVAGLPVVEGSGFQYFDASSGAGLYSSRWNPSVVSRLPDGTVRVRYAGADSRATGSIEFSYEGDTLVGRYEHKWRGDRPVVIESCLGLLWSSPLVRSTVRLGQADVPTTLRPLTGTFEQRQIGSQANVLEVFGPVANWKMESSGTEFSVFDTRRFSADWARNRGAFWAGIRRTRIPANGSVAWTVRWSGTSVPLTGVGSSAEKRSWKLARVRSASNKPIPLVPSPISKIDQPGWLTIGSSFDWKGQVLADDPLARSFEATLASYWSGQGDAIAKLETRLAPALGAQSYKLRVDGNGAVIEGGDMAGIRNGLGTLLLLPRPHVGQLAIRCTEIVDRPKVAKRGVHLYSSSRSPVFHEKLTSRMLWPLKFNWAVYDCSRTLWPGLPRPGMDWASLEDLRATTELFRKHGLEPTPLVQSLGHMEWLLADPGRSQLAVDPNIPYTLDVRKQESRDLIDSIWDTALNVTGAQSIHFGMDEVDSRGMPNGDGLATRLWRQQLAAAAIKARDKGVKAFIWGDMMVASDEAPDAQHAPDSKTAKERRSALPSNVSVVDWHYVDNSDPSAYRSLALWPAGRRTAAFWNKGNNIRGHVLAAIANGAATLHTTWAGTRGDEASALTHLDQVASYALSAQYAWTGTTAKPSDIGFSTQALVRRLLFSPAEPVVDRMGRTVAGTAPFMIGGYMAERLDALPLRSLVTSEGRPAPLHRTFELDSSARCAFVFVDCVGWMGFGDPVAELEVTLSDGSTERATILYGPHVRCVEDTEPTPLADAVDGVRVFALDFGRTVQVKSVSIKSIDSFAGVRLHGMGVY